jgi:hypothetical protein
MKALISPDEKSYSYDGTLLGMRVAEVSDVEFPVAAPLFWWDCTDECVADLWYYSNGQCLPKPLPPEPEQPVEE